MKQSGMEWTAHVGYLILLTVGFFFWKNKLEEAARIKAEVGPVEELVVPVLFERNNYLLKKIDRSSMRHSDVEVEQASRKIHHAADLIYAFSQKCHTALPGKEKELVADYYCLADSLRACFSQDTGYGNWLDRILASDYKVCSMEQLTNWLVNSDLNSKQLLIKNLKWKANLALYKALEDLAYRLEHSDFTADAYMPIIINSYNSYPHVGEAFGADITLMPYVSKIESIKLNDQTLPAKNGIAQYRTSFSLEKRKSDRLEITAKHPVTGKEIRFERDF